MPNPTADQAAQLKQIEDMLAKGMSEEDILASLRPGPVPNSPEWQTMVRRDAHIGPVEDPVNPIVDWVLKNFAGIQRGTEMDSQEFSGSLPLPFTDRRLNPGDFTLSAATGLIGLPSLVKGAASKIAPHLPGARARSINNMLNEMIPSRTVRPDRMLPPHASSGNVTHIRPDPAFPRGVVDDIPNSWGDDFPWEGPHPNFLPQETIETAAFGTLNPGGGKLTDLALELAKKARKGKSGF